MTDHNDTTQDGQPPMGRVAIYRRNAAAAQAPTLLTQTSDLLALAHAQGYANEQIIVFEEGYGAKRAALLDLLMQIAQPAQDQEPIKALFVGAESRLFRDSEVVQVSTFIELCRTYQVLLITPTRVYDFSKPVDVAQFRFACDGADEYIINRLQADKRAAAARRRQANQQAE